MKYLLMENVNPVRKKVVATAYVAPWKDGSLGWAVPHHITDKSVEQVKGKGYEWAAGEWSYRCRITIELLPDKKGRIRRLRVNP